MHTSAAHIAPDPQAIVTMAVDRLGTLTERIVAMVSATTVDHIESLVEPYRSAFLEQLEELATEANELTCDLRERTR
ncbi:hypothetical protein PTE30175_01966 [Pandoraea terrae]|uniref:Uncharacterized protein n=1 Tax=Pandoraea terrae TaxID=1537710 RepID=A0A5E4UI97_9BURK|nr:hypothetical protein [Pandoraea terrae]VVD99252.1 hypothetical protein PTE30175_01966 [Pandoraea terrae]